MSKLARFIYFYTNEDEGEKPVPFIYNTVTGLSPLALVNALVKPIRSLTQYGKCVQDGTPTPDAPVWPTINNGTVKAWTVRGIPLAIDTDETGLINKDTGAVDANSNYRITEPIFVPAGGYNLKVTFALTNSSRVFCIYAYAEDGTPLYPCVTATHKVGEQVYPFTISADCYIRANYRYAGNSDISIEAVNPIVYVDGTPEVLTVADQTATVPDLYAVGNYKDEAEIIGGTVTRKVGMKVLDGTEEWNVTGGVAYYISIPEMKACNPVEAGLSSHFVGLAAATSAMPENSVKLTYATFESGQVGAISIRHNAASANDFKAFLAAQYAAGTPVIVVYPLATETTEQVAGQPLYTSEGSNTVTVTSEVGEVELRVEYATEAAT